VDFKEGALAASLLLTPGFFPDNEEMSAPPPCGFLIGIYIFCEDWSTETFRKRDSKKWSVCYAYKSSLNDDILGWGLRVENTYPR